MTVTSGREALIASVATSLEGRSFAYTQGEHHRKFASKIVDDVLRLAAKPSSDPDAMNERRVEEDARESLPDDIRALGWMVAVHNDYRQLGEPHTFWLFTKDGRAVKGEGMSDAEALNKIRALISTTGEPKRTPEDREVAHEDCLNCQCKPHERCKP